MTDGEGKPHKCSLLCQRYKNVGLTHERWSWRPRQPLGSTWLTWSHNSRQGIMKMVLLHWITFLPSAKITAYQHHRNQAKTSPSFSSSDTIPPFGRKCNKIAHFVIPACMDPLKLKPSSPVNTQRRPVYGYLIASSTFSNSSEYLDQI